MKSYLATLLLFNCLTAITLAVSDENICDTTCQYCCRNKQCQSQSTCQGNYQPFIILGAVAGGLIALFIARRVYVHYRRKQAIAEGRVQEKKASRPSRWRRKGKAGAKSPSKEKKSKEPKAKKTRSSSKPGSIKDTESKKVNMNVSKGDIYLQIGDNESVLSAEDVKSTKNKDGGKSSRGTSRNELKPSSKNEILAKSDTNLDKDRLNPYKQNRIPEQVKPEKAKSTKDKENKNNDKRSTSKGKSSASSKKPEKDMKDSMRESKMTASTKERGRSRDAGDTKERANSQKRPASGTRNDKSRGNSTGAKKNQI